TPGGDAVHLVGRFFDRFAVDGTLTLSPAPALAASITFQGLPIEQLLPELAKIGEVRGVASGRVDVSLGASGTLRVGARLSELKLVARVAEDDGTPSSLEFANEDEVRAVFDGTRLRFDHLHMQSAKGELLVVGTLDPQVSDLQIQGSIDLELIEYFARSLF